MEILKVACYCRVSTDSKDQANSFENQQTYFQGVLANNNNFKLINIYADKGLTGTKLNNRPEFNKMIKDSGIDIIEQFTGKDRRQKKKNVIYEISERQPLFSEIWIKNTSRFARNTLSFDIISKLRNKGVNINFIEQNINTKHNSNDFQLKLYQLFDEQDSRDKSSKVIFGIREGARRGKINTNSRLYGYNYIQTENRLEIIEREAVSIRKIFELYNNGIGIRRIINYLVDQAIYTRDGKPFCKSSIKRILTNEKYAGINVRMKYSTGEVFNKYSYPHINSKDEWIVTETDKIPAMVSKDLFEQCQNILEDKVNHLSQVGIYKGITEYAGLIYCGKCGSSYLSNVDRGRRFYNCKTKRQKGTNECDNTNISLAKLDQLITTINYRRYVFQRKTINIVMLEGLEGYLKNKSIINSNKEVNNLNLELSKNKLKRIKLLNLYLSGNVDECDFLDTKKPLDSKIDNLEKKIEQITKPYEELLKDIEQIRETIEKINSMDIKSIYSKEDLVKEIEKIIINKDKVQIIYKIEDRIKGLMSKYDFSEFEEYTITTPM